jgi:hypothetical protein
MALDARSIAVAMGGAVQGGAANVPGPGHKPCDRSLRVFPDPDADGGFRVHSFAGDDPIECRDFVRAKLGLPAFQPSREREPRGVSIKPSVPPAITSEGAVPSRTAPDSDGKPRFHQWGEDGPPRHDNEIRRHVYRDAGRAVRIKVKSKPASPDLPVFVNWYRVNNGAMIGWQAQKPAGYQAVPYIGAVNPFDTELTADLIFWPEGERIATLVASTICPLSRLAARATFPKMFQGF